MRSSTESNQKVDRVRRLATKYLSPLVASVIGLAAVACEKRTSPDTDTSAKTASPQNLGGPTTSKEHLPDAEVQAKVIAIIAKETRVRVSEINPAIRLHNDLVTTSARIEIDEPAVRDLSRLDPRE
jgi:hypothetical protein